MLKNLLIASLALVLTACVPIPTQEPPTPVSTPQRHKCRLAWTILRPSSPR